MIRLLIWIPYVVYACIVCWIFQVSHATAIALACLGLVVVLAEGRIHFARARRRS